MIGRIQRQVEDYLSYCKNTRDMSETTMLAKENILKRFVAVTRLRDLRGLTNRVFDSWTAHEVERGVSARSINTYNATIVALVRYHQGAGLVVSLNLTMVKKLKEVKTRRRFYTAEEIERVIGYADEETGLMIEMMFETGMRIAELTRLRVGSFEGRRVKFVGKGRKLREAYVSEETFGLVRGYLVGRRKNEFLWGVEMLNGMPPTVNTVRNRLRRAFDEAGLQGFYPHALRHSFATNLQLKGASVAEIKEMMGHESIATTERYLHGFEGRLDELFEKYG